MIPFVLLFLTAVLTGWQLFYRIMLGIWGVPNHWFHGVSLLGSVVLLVASYISMWSRRTGFKIALVGLFAVGVTFVPSLPGLVVPPPDRILRWYLYVPSIVFYVTAVYVAFGLTDPKSSVLYPSSATKASKIGVILMSLALVTGTGWYAGGLGRRELSTEQMTWELVPSIGSESANAKIRLTSVARPQHTITVASRDLRSYLERERPSRVSVVVEKIYDHRKYRGWGLKSIAGRRDPALTWLGSSGDPD